MKRLLITLALLGASIAHAQDQVLIPQTGQQTMANSTSVVIASDQSAVPISAASLPLPSGAATSANQSTTIGHVDQLEGYLDLVETKLDSIISAQLPDSHNVTVDNATLAVTQSGAWTNACTQSGTWTARITDGTDTAEVLNLASNDPLAVAIVDGSGTQITSFGGGTQYTEDDPSAANPIGTQLIARRRDALTTETGTDGDSVALNTTNKGELYVKHVDAIPVTDNGGELTVNYGSGTFPISAASLPLPTGASTSANQSTIIGHVDGLEGFVDGVETSLNNIDADATTIIGHVDGIETLIGTTNTTLGTIDTDTGNIDTSLNTIEAATQVLGTDVYTEAASRGITLGAVRRDADTTLVNTTNEFTPLQVDTNGRLKVEAFSGETLPVSLTSTTITGSVAVTNAGTFATQIDGAALTALQLIDNPVATDGSAAVTGLFQVGGTDGTNAQILSTDTSGQLKVVGAGAANVATTGNPVLIAGTDGTNTRMIRTSTNGSPVIDSITNAITVNSHAVTNAGTFATQESGALLTSSQLIDDAVTTTASAITTKGIAASGTDGTNARILKTDTSGELQVDVLSMPTTTVQATNLDVQIGGSDSLTIGTLPSIPAGSNNIGDVDVLSIAAGTNAIGNVGIIPRTSGGLDTYHLVSAATTNATVVKASAGQLFGWFIYNSNAAARKVAFHNTASSPTAGSSVFFSLVIPPSSGANVFSETGITFGTGIAITTVTGLADSDATAVAANDLIINLWYE